MKNLKFLLLFIFCINFVSCVEIETIVPGVSFDEEEFNAQNKKWNELNIKNYSFKYTFGRYDLPYETRGNVIVENMVGTVEFEDEDDLDKESIFFLEIKSIDEAFKAIYDNYNKSLEKSETNSSYITYRIKYDSDYGFPMHVSNDEKTNELKNELTGISSCDFVLNITDFQVNESE